MCCGQIAAEPERRGEGQERLQGFRKQTEVHSSSNTSRFYMLDCRPGWDNTSGRAGTIRQAGLGQYVRPD